MNFAAAMLLSVLPSEREAFWTLGALVEDILPGCGFLPSSSFLFSLY